MTVASISRCLVFAICVAYQCTVQALCPKPIPNAACIAANCNKYCDILCRNQGTTYCSMNTKTGKCDAKGLYPCGCEGNIVVATQCTTTTPKLAAGDTDCHIDHAVGPCDKKWKSNGACYWDCNGKCVYNFVPTNALTVLTGPCIKYCNPIPDCDCVEKDRYQDIDCELDQKTCEQECQACDSKHAEVDTQGKKIWSNCKLETDCAEQTCVATKLSTASDAKPEKTWCIKYREPKPCPDETECNQVTIAQCKKCKPCEWDDKTEAPDLPDGKCYVDGKGDCVYDLHKFDDNIILEGYSRKCIKNCDESSAGRKCSSDNNCGSECMKCCRKRKICEKRKYW